MIYNCDSIWDSQQWWLILFCTGDIVHSANNYNHEFVNALQIKYSENRPQAQ